jgi:hypothetical protein
MDRQGKRIRAVGDEGLGASRESWSRGRQGTGAYGLAGDKQFKWHGTRAKADMGQRPRGRQESRAYG